MVYLTNIVDVCYFESYSRGSTETHFFFPLRNFPTSKSKAADIDDASLNSSSKENAYQTSVSNNGRLMNFSAWQIMMHHFATAKKNPALEKVRRPSTLTRRCGSAAVKGGLHTVTHVCDGKRTWTDKSRVVDRNEIADDRGGDIYRRSPFAWQAKRKQLTQCRIKNLWAPRQ
jgi:hypothetical protein